MSHAYLATGEKVLTPMKGLARQVSGRLGQAFHPADWQGSLNRMYLMFPQSPQMAYHLLLASWLLSSSGVQLVQTYKKIYPQRVLIVGSVGLL